ncbi:MAG: hypothetical protein Q7S82_02790 [bacterium]|nr:hypothetical protein [bacterium]
MQEEVIVAANLYLQNEQLKLTALLVVARNEYDRVVNYMKLLSSIAPGLEALQVQDEKPGEPFSSLAVQLEEEITLLVILLQSHLSAQTELNKGNHDLVIALIGARITDEEELKNLQDGLLQLQRDETKPEENPLVGQFAGVR